MANVTPPHTLRAQRWARDLFALPNFYVIDTETTGMSPRDEVVQIGIIDKNGHTVLESLVKATIKPHPKASEVNGITAETLVNAPTFADLYVQLSGVLAGQTLVAYNMDFDWRLLTQTAARYGLPTFRTGKRHCAMKQYAQYKGQRNKTGNQYRWHSLSAACTQQRIKVENAHTAVGDCLMTLALMKRMMA